MLFRSLPAIKLGSVKILKKSLEQFLQDNEGKDFSDLNNITKLDNLTAREND